MNRTVSHDFRVSPGRRVHWCLTILLETVSFPRAAVSSGRLGGEIEVMAVAVSAAILAEPASAVRFALAIGNSLDARTTKERP